MTRMRAIFTSPRHQRLPQPQLPPQQPPPPPMPIEDMGAGPDDEPRPMPAITEISRRVSALWHIGHATLSALAEEVMASKRPTQPWQRDSWSGTCPDCSPDGLGGDSDG